MLLAQGLPPFPPSSDCSLCISLVGFVYLLKKIEDNISGFFTEFGSLIPGSLLLAPPWLWTEVVARGREGGREGGPGAWLGCTWLRAQGCSLPGRAEGLHPGTREKGGELEKRGEQCRDVQSRTRWG